MPFEMGCCCWAIGFGSGLPEPEPKYAAYLPSPSDWGVMAFALGVSSMSSSGEMKLGATPLAYRGPKPATLVVDWLAGNGCWELVPLTTAGCERAAGCDCDLSELLEAGAPFSAWAAPRWKGRR